MVYFGDHLLPIKGKEFDILCTLAEHPMQIVLHNELYTLIESKHYKDLLLRQYICNIRKAFPPPYCDPHHPQCIIVSRRMEGYYLNLPQDHIKIEPA
jgi:DNA-binding response OmpR family regulator